MSHTVPHPLRDFGARTAILSLGVAAAMQLVFRHAPSGLLADLSSLMAGFALLSLLLWPGRLWGQPSLVAVHVAIVWLLASTGVVLWQHYVALPQLSQMRDGLAQMLIAAGVLAGCVIYPVGPRWLAWREQRALDAQAAQHATERALLEARLAALQGQIEPHFLFNTLANVQYLLRHDAQAADQMLDHLIAYLRATLPELRQRETPLAQELARVRAYLDIMRIRMGDRLHYQIDCSDALGAAAIPPLSLATLVENALKHGLEPKRGGGQIAIQAAQQGDRLCVSIDDDGIGFSETSSGGGVGLRNLRERLATQFGERAALTLEARASGGVRAQLILPLVYPESP